MANEVDYVPWAIGGSANVYNAATYQALPTLSTGVEPGLADSKAANTTWRLASMMSSAVANFISQQLNISVLDDGNLTNLISEFTSAVAVGSASKPGRIVTSSATLNMLTSDYAIGLNRTTGLAAMTINLPSGAAVNQEFAVFDLARNVSPTQYPATIVPPAGHSIAGLASVQLNVNGGCVILHYFGSNIWGVKL